MSGTRWCAPALLLGLAACAGGNRGLVAASNDLGRAVDRGDNAELDGRLHPAARAGVDREALADESSGWADSLSRPTSARPEARLELAPGEVVKAVYTDAGWRFVDDPSDPYSQATPLAALRALIRASRRGRWDVMVELAPRRYRVGLSAEDVRRAWSEGAQADDLAARRDRLEEHLAQPIRADAHHAVLNFSDGESAHLEREQGRWVIVDF